MMGKPYPNPAAK